MRRVDISGAADADCISDDGEILSSDEIEDRRGGGGAGQTFNFDGQKSEDYANKRGWTSGAIKGAVQNGQTGSSVNRANGNTCAVYSHPSSVNQYVVIDNVTLSVVQVSNLHDAGWKTDTAIIWFDEGRTYK